MIFINHFGSSQAAVDYHAHLSRGDYFAKDAEHLMPRFEGETARMLGIEGMVADKENWKAIVNNLHPVTGEKITPGWKEDRRSMTELTFDVPKSVSLAGLVDKRVDRAMKDAVDETMLEIQEDMATRVRKNGADSDRVTGNMAWVVWPHETSRPLEDGTVDPQKHRHVTVLNMTFDKEEGIYKATQFGNIVRDKGYFQSAYHARLSGKLAELGYGIERDGTSFKLVGIEKELTDKFSRRTAVIEKEAEAKGIADPAEKGKLGRRTRNKKGDELSTPELEGEWLARMTPQELQAVKNARNRGGEKAFDVGQAVDYAIAHSFYHESAIPERQLKGEALRYAVGSVSPEEVERHLASREDVIHVKRSERKMVTTHEALNAEIEMLAFARNGHGRYGPLALDAAKHLPEGLSGEQGAAAARILNSRDRVIGFRGGAGTGKTTTLEAIVQGIEKSGKRVMGTAVSTSAVDELKGVGISETYTLAGLLQSPKLQSQLKGGVLVVDEASQIGTGDMGQLFKVAKAQQARVVLSGDYRQHGSVKAGDSFRLLAKEAGVRFAELKEIRRQKPKEYRDAVMAISSGKRDGILKGFDALDRMGAIIEAPGEMRHGLLVSDYLQAVDDKKSALIVTPTHKEARHITETLRGELKERGGLGNRERQFVIRKATNWTDAEKTDKRNYEPGMVVEFYQNAKGGFKRGETAVVVSHPGSNHGAMLLRPNGQYAEIPVEVAKRFQVYRTESLNVAKGERIRLTQNGKLLTESGREMRVKNGDIFTVTGVNKEGHLTVDGKIIPKAYGHFTHGYVDTSFASQGKTTDRVFIAAGSGAAVNSQQWYVSVSRGKEAAKIYVSDKQEMRQAITKPGERLAAVELVEGTRHAHRKTTWGDRVKERLERNRVYQYVRERAERVIDQVRERRAYGIGS